MSEKGEEPVLVGLGTLVSVRRSVQLQPSPYLCQKDGVVLQLWVDSYDFSTHNPVREWRPLMEFDKAAKSYNTVKVQGD